LFLLNKHSSFLLFYALVALSSIFKIKFKNVSFLNFTNRFKNFLQKRLEKKLEKTKLNVEEMDAVLKA